MFDRLFQLLLLGIGTCLVVVSQGRSLHLLLFASFALSVAATSFVDATYKDLQGNSTEIDIKSEPILGILSSLGLKGRYSTSAAILFGSFIMLSTFSIIAYKLTPHSLSEAMGLAGLKPGKEQIELKQSWDGGPPTSLEIRHDNQALGELGTGEILTELRELASRGVKESSTPAITKTIYEECRGSDGLCQISKLHKVNISFSTELDISSRNGGVVANICPLPSENSEPIREELLNGAKIRVHATREPGTNLLASTPYLDNGKVGEYDPYPPSEIKGKDSSSLVANAKKACLGKRPYIQLPASYQNPNKPFTPTGKDGFTTGFLTVEKEIVTR